MKNGNRYYNQPLYAILKRDKDGNIMAYGGHYKDPEWSDKNVLVFDDDDLSLRDYSTPKWNKIKPGRLGEGMNLIKDILRYWTKIKIETGEQVFWVRLRSKKCPIMVDFPNIVACKNPFLRASQKILAYKLK